MKHMRYKDVECVCVCRLSAIEINKTVCEGDEGGVRVRVKEVNYKNLNANKHECRILIECTAWTNEKSVVDACVGGFCCAQRRRISRMTMD